MLTGPNSLAGKLYKKLTGHLIPKETDGDYSALIVIFDMLQAAGPDLTPQNMARGVHALPTWAVRSIPTETGAGTPGSTARRGSASTRPTSTPGSSGGTGTAPRRSTASGAPMWRPSAASVSPSARGRRRCRRCSRRRDRPLRLEPGARLGCVTSGRRARWSRPAPPRRSRSPMTEPTDVQLLAIFPCSARAREDSNLQPSDP